MSVKRPTTGKECNCYCRRCSHGYHCNRVRTKCRAEKKKTNPTNVLRHAIRHVEETYPLPRCPHGHALRDNSGDALGPYDCGCGGQVRKVFLDFDARRKPKTKRYCVKCQKDIFPTAEARIVRVEDVHVIHPDYIVPLIGEDCLVGMDCARQLGMDFTRPEKSKESQ